MENKLKEKIEDILRGCQSDYQQDVDEATEQLLSLIDEEKVKSSFEGYRESALIEERQNHLKPKCFIGNEYLDFCPACKGKIKIIREGTIANPVSDIVECDCSRWEIPNSINLMGNTLHFGDYKHTYL